MLKNKMKQIVAALLSVTIMVEPLFCAEAKINTNVSLSQRVKNGIQSIGKIFKNNAKEIAIFGGAGAGLFALVLTGIMCNRKGSGGTTVECNSQSSSNSVTVTVSGVESGPKSASEPKTFLELGNEEKTSLIVADEPKSEPEVKPKQDTELKSVMGDTDELAIDDTSDSKALLEHGNEEKTSLIVADEPKSEPEVKPKQDTELKSVTGDSEESVYGAQYDTEYDSDRLFDIDTDGSATHPKIVMLPTVGFGVKIDYEPLSRTPSPGSDIVEINDDLKDVSFIFSEDLNRQIGSFCGDRYNVNAVRALIEFLARIKNKHHKFGNITSLVEANFTRCEQKINGFNNGKRTIDCDVIREFSGRIAAMGPQFSVAHWKNFKEKFLRGIVLYENSLEFDANRLVVKMK